MKPKENSTGIMRPGFDYLEAKDMIGLAYCADQLAPTGTGKAWVGFGSVQLPPANNPNTPIDPDRQKALPYPEDTIWPDGWKPGLPGEVNAPWNNSVITSSIPNPSDNKKPDPIGSNFALFTYHPERDAYCVAFAGTTNLPTMMQDVLYTPVSAGPDQVLEDSERYGYYSPTTYLKAWTHEEVVLKDESDEDSTPPVFQPPPVVVPTLSSGIRFGLETLTIRKTEDDSLISMLKKTGRKRMNLFITGHSLGAGMASLFAAWLQAGNLPSIEFNIKTYAFGPEKLGNEAFINNFNLGLTNQGFHFVIKNTLDIAPQLPVNKGVMADLVNPKGTLTWLPYLTQQVLAEQAILLGEVTPGSPVLNDNYNYFHPGFTITLQASGPVIYSGEYYPPVFYNGEANHPIQYPGMDDFSVAFLRIWWQHLPWNYRFYLDRTFGESPQPKLNQRKVVRKIGSKRIS